ncbi:metallophosphoesterase [Acinetobacter schindleri]|uniref:metallophosphoesterase n=1 Tax=Acinetobacter schindleri TaxID=108981 RepID=UPI0013B09834|nr:metallophosphoesterase [Acinetobacter schindleri]MBB4834852.1 serine/threonine protein phosphatase 1 [Acinetobacter schindleri]MEB5928421.1 metallophosphoesterase [Acinetobacter schindleri]QIC59898.1 serine/threonine-protein phosphatase 2 [Acinetobacter schindleri]WBX39485.1 metallophosphoesterase [Acinetobacter schindleri]
MMTLSRNIRGADYAAIYVVGDLHGCYRLLMQELEKIRFNFEQDLLICTGDLVDRGSENLECISLLDQPWFSSVRGNHEEMCIKGRDDVWIQDMHARNGGEWFYLLSTEKQDELSEILSKLPLVIEIQLEDKNIGILHADIDIHDWNQFKTNIAKGERKIPGLTSAYTNALWGRGRIRHHSKRYGTVKNIDEIYLGHTIVKRHTQIDNCHYIDIGSSYTQKLCIVKIK